MLLMVGLVIVALLACRDDDRPPPCVNCPPSSAGVTLSNAWPNDDQTAWTYRYEYRNWWWAFQPRLYATKDDVPPVPNWSVISDLLSSHAQADSVVISNAEYHLRFDGGITTTRDVEAQNLVEEMVVEVGQRVARPGPRSDRTFLSRLYAARPDLRDDLARYTGWSGTESQATQWVGPWPLLVRGGAWEKTAQWIGTYGDLDALLAWKFLSTDLRRGSEFEHQLVPALADDVYLYAHISGVVEVLTDVGEFDDALECLYIVDYGTITVRNQYNEPVGFYRVFDYGRVIYAPEIGPVYSYERMSVQSGDPPTVGTGESELSILTMTPP